MAHAVVWIVRTFPNIVVAAACRTSDIPPAIQVRVLWAGSARACRLGEEVSAPVRIRRPIVARCSDSAGGLRGSRSDIAPALVMEPVAASRGILRALALEAMIGGRYLAAAQLRSSTLALTQVVRRVLIEGDASPARVPPALPRCVLGTPVCVAPLSGPDVAALERAYIAPFVVAPAPAV